MSAAAAAAEEREQVAAAERREEMKRLREQDSLQVLQLRESFRKLECLCSLPLSVYFNAVRELPYTGGGEEYLVTSVDSECLAKERDGDIFLNFRRFLLAPAMPGAPWTPRAASSLRQ